MKIKAIALIIGICLTSSPAICGKIPVFVSIMPQKYFVEKIGGSLVDVIVMVSPGASPATYEPKPKQMSAIYETKIYFAVGVPFENVWLEKIAGANPKMKIVYTQDGIEKIPMEADHDHGEHKKALPDKHLSDRSILDPHIWLSPPLVMIQARNIMSALAEIDPDHQETYEQNYREFILAIVDLDMQFKRIFSGKQGMGFMVFHPAWGYFAKAYGLKQIPVEIEGKEPKPADLKHLIDHATKYHIKVIFVQPQFSTQNASVIANSIGGKTIFLDPLAEQWADNLKEAAEKLKEALK